MNKRLDDIISEHTDKKYEGTDFVGDEIQHLEKTKKGQVKNSREKFKIDKIHDVFDQFGYGVVAYFVTLKRLMFVYCIISVLLIPVFYVYQDGKFLKNTNSANGIHSA